MDLAWTTLEAARAEVPVGPQAASYWSARDHIAKQLGLGDEQLVAREAGNLAGKAAI